MHWKIFVICLLFVIFCFSCSAYILKIVIHDYSELAKNNFYIGSGSLILLAPALFVFLTGMYILLEAHYPGTTTHLFY